LSIALVRGRLRLGATRMLLVLAALFVVGGCGDPAHDLAIRNGSRQELLVRVTETASARDHASDVSVFVAPARSYGWAFGPGAGQLQGTIEVLRSDCSVIGRVPAQGGSIVSILPDRPPVIRYLSNAEDQPIGTLATTDRCGGKAPSGG
jgi:hypothetical protein